MPDLKPITSLGSSQAKTLAVGALSLTENSSLALASLALRRGADTPIPFGLVLPGPGAWAAAGNVAAFWTGPGQWMIEAQGRAEDDFAGEIAAACSGQTVTEQTDGFVAFEIQSHVGAEPILRLMAKLANIDPRRFQAGSATRTGLDHLSVFLIRRAEDHLAVLGMRSAAGTLWYKLERTIKLVAQAYA